MEKKFSSTKMTPIRRVLKKDITRVLSLKMFYENRNKHDVQGIGFSCFCIMDNYVCVDYLGCPQTKLHVQFSNKGLKNTMMC